MTDAFGRSKRNYNDFTPRPFEPPVLRMHLTEVLLAGQSGKVPQKNQKGSTANELAEPRRLTGREGNRDIKVYDHRILVSNLNFLGYEFAVLLEGEADIGSDPSCLGLVDSIGLRDFQGKHLLHGTRRGIGSFFAVLACASSWARSRTKRIHRSAILGTPAKRTGPTPVQAFSCHGVGSPRQHDLASTRGGRH